MKRPPPLPSVTDHAVLRYLERAKGVDVHAVRRHIADLVRRGVEKQGDAVVVEGVKFVLVENRVVTTVPKNYFRHEGKPCVKREAGDA